MLEADVSLPSITNQIQGVFTNHARNDSDANIAGRNGTKINEHPKQIEETSGYAKSKRGMNLWLN